MKTKNALTAGNTIAMLDDMQQRGMIRGDWHGLIDVADSLEELKEKIV